MNAQKLFSILDPLRAAYDYGMAASMNSNSEERAELETKMLNRLARAIENAGLRSADVKRAA